jgi:hypothetical protein
MNSKRTKCKRCESVLTERERAFLQGYCEECRKNVEEEFKKRKSGS